MKTFFADFKKFAIKGNALDLAIGVIIGGAFGKIITSLTENILTPFLGVLTKGVDFREASINFLGVDFHYGLFISSVVDFFIVALVLFLIVKFVIGLRKEEVQKEKIAPKSDEIKLLEEIRDLLKK